MKKMKKVFAVILSLAMVLGMSMTTFAAPEKAPARVSGIEEGEGIQVTAYKIIRYNDAGYYEAIYTKTENGKEVSSITEVDAKDSEGKVIEGAPKVLKPTAEDILALYARTNEMGDGVPLTRDAATGDYLLDTEEAGSWLIVVTGNTKNLYNPAIVSNSVGADGTDYGRLNMAVEGWDGAVVKKSMPEITKTAKSADGSDPEVTGTQYGDVLEFTIESDIPNYAADGRDIRYSVQDTLSGLTLVNWDKATATIEGIAEEDKNVLTDAMIKAPANDGKSFNLDLSKQDDFIRKYQGKKIIIVYQAQVTSDALLSVDFLNNTATLDYSTNHSNQNAQDTDETNHYSFGLDTRINGWQTSEDKTPTGEFVKINDKGEVEYVPGKTEVTSKSTDLKYLPGAQFELRTTADDSTTAVTAKTGKLNADGSRDKTNPEMITSKVFTTDTDGFLEIVGLDDDVTYYLVETKAPSGYTVNSTPIPVKITATYAPKESKNGKGKLTGYTVTIGSEEGTGGVCMTHYTFNSNTNKPVIDNTPGTANNPFGFKNTRLAGLPSTGGIGTTIFTIGGCAIMIVAAALFFASRKKSAK